MTPLPSLFISHGGPNIVIDDLPARRFLEGLSDLVGQPKAIVVMSAHFETHGVTVVTDPKPEMIYDFGGFDPQLYRMVYPAPGDPALAERAISLLEEAGLAPARLGRRGYDHGAWTPLKLAFPKADIPVVQISVDPDRDARWHYAVGRALAPLREEGVLVVGSGHITHNLRVVIGVMRSGRAMPPEIGMRFDGFVDWFADRIAEHDLEALLDWRARAPFAADNHPTDEHLMPLFFALGAGGVDAAARRIHASREYASFAYDSYAFA
jgi:4,5-DOPA dioxygenase extradiol